MGLIRNSLFIKSFVFKLPDDVWREILSTWLLVKDLGQLDRSATCLDTRARFLSILRNIRYIKLEHREIFHIGLYEWLFVRGICLNKLSLSSKIVDANGEVTVRLHCEMIESVEIAFKRADVNNGLNNFLKSCASLKRLSLHGVNNVSGLDPCVLQRLHHLSVVGGKQDMTEMMEAIGSNCSSLTKLHINNEVQGNLLLPILISNPKLQVILVNCDQSVLGMLAQHCKCLNRISLSTSSPVDLLLVRDVLTEIPCIEHVSVMSLSNGFVYANTTDDRSVVFTINSSYWDRNSLYALLANIRGLSTFGFVMRNESEFEVNFPLDAIVAGLEFSASTLTKLDLVKFTPQIAEALFNRLPKVRELVWTSSYDLTDLFKVFGKQLHRIRFSNHAWSIDEVRAHLALCPNLVDAYFSIELSAVTGDWSSPLSREVGHIASVTLMCLENSMFRHGIVFEYGKRVDEFTSDDEELV